MIFKPGELFSLFAIFYLACADFNFHQNCVGAQQTYVELAIYDVVYLAGRAALTLSQVLNSPTGINPWVAVILDAFLSEEADRSTYQYVLGEKPVINIIFSY